MISPEKRRPQAEPSGSYSSRRLRRPLCERMIREEISVEVEFQVDQAVQNLIMLGLAADTEGGKFRVIHR